jgi:hypothetical protein
MGLQRRIMLYAAIGLALMFFGFAYLGFNAVNRTTQLVFQERVKLAQSVAAAVEQSLDHVVSDVLEEALEGAQWPSQKLASEVFRHLTEVDAFALMHISGAWVVDGNGMLLGAAPNEMGWSEDWAQEARRVAREGRAGVTEAVSNIGGGIPFAVVSVPLLNGSGGMNRVVMVHTEARSTVEPFNPYTTLEVASGGGLALAKEETGPLYQMEIVTT